MNIDQQIITFIKEHHLLTLATSINGSPYCCNLYYVYNSKANKLCFSSDIKTKHAQDFIKNNNVAGSISVETKDISLIQGVQLLGKVFELRGEELRDTKNIYLKAFPYAKSLPIHLWSMQLHYIKMTDNKLGFGKKLIWKK
tara:strand:- start:104 stop:526 length:423 start_codon:yes stop_codon:yes gene_type:complete